MVVKKMATTYKGFSTVSALSQKKFKLLNHDLIKQDITNILMTRQGGRVMQPTVGCIAWDKLFDPITNTDVEDIANNITSLIGNDPRVKITAIDVSQSVNTITITLTLQYTDTNEIETMRIAFNESL